MNNNFNAITPDAPILIADRTWWVGHYLEDDVFQCHVYLLENGEQSVLFDPGSQLTYRYSLKKIEQIIPFAKIKYFVCHHQDPDITGSMPAIDNLVARKDAVLVTHWRGEMLIKHYGLKIPFWRIEEHDWQLTLEDRILRFIFTPYAHFPGAFCSFDTKTGTLFSSDLFGGFTQGFVLYAQDESHFENIRPFHEHYMPSRDVLLYSLNKFESLPITLIAPQHGSIIPQHLVSFMIGKLKSLDCGLYLLAQDHTDIRRLSRLNQMLRDITKTLIIYRDFHDIAQALLKIAQGILPITSLEFYACTNEDGTYLHLAPETRYRGKLTDAPRHVCDLMHVDHKTWDAGHKWTFEIRDQPLVSLLLPLFSPDMGTIRAVAVFNLSSGVIANDEVNEMIEQMLIPLQVAVEREVLYRTLDLESQKFYERSIRDALTGLFTRFYMQDTLNRLFDIHDRDPNALIGIIMVDIDHFKSINDTYGHNQGDEVLKRVARVLMNTVRSCDLAVRMGGEEFAIFVVGESVRQINILAERLRSAVAIIHFDGVMTTRQITISLGTAIRHQHEELTDFIERADHALYTAKDGGRNQVRAA